MRKTLFGLVAGLGLLFSGANSYSQEVSDSIPKVVKDKAANYLSYAASNCGTIPDVSLVGEKIEDREDNWGNKDGVKDSVFLYQINNPCIYLNVPSHFVYIRNGKKDGTFEKTGRFTETGIFSRDNKYNPIMPKDW